MYLIYLYKFVHWNSAIIRDRPIGSPIVWGLIMIKRGRISPSGITPLSIHGRVDLTDATGIGIDYKDHAY